MPTPDHTEQLAAVQAMCRAANKRGMRILGPDEYEPAEDRTEDMDELSDLDYHGQHERFTS